MKKKHDDTEQMKDMKEGQEALSFENYRSLPQLLLQIKEGGNWQR